MIEWGVKSLWQNGKDILCILCRMLPTQDIAPHIILLHFYMACCFYLKSTGPWKINFLYGMSQPTYFYKLHLQTILKRCAWDTWWYEKHNSCYDFTSLRKIIKNFDKPCGLWWCGDCHTRLCYIFTPIDNFP